MRFTLDDEVALAFVIRAAALQKMGDKQAALEASARAFSRSCGVERAHVQLMIFDQLGTLLLDTGHARRAIPAAGPRAVWSGLGWHAYGSKCMQTQWPVRKSDRSDDEGESG